MPRLQQILEPARAAVIIVDMQNDFCSPEGATAKAGRSVQMATDLLPRLQRLVDGAREHGIPIVFVQVNNLPYTTSEAWAYRASEKPRVGNCQAGTWGAEAYGVIPQPGDPIVVKHRNSGFHQTRLDLILRSLKVETVVVTGCATNVSLEMTARDAVQHDYNLIVPEDCAGAYEQHAHETALHTLRTFYGWVTTSDEVLAIWRDWRASSA